ncbi:MAG TPA: hypothetical protein VGS11_06985 [Candidatus Bathyarchaeia archaeon]|nr:hypothetical protein [Candidatus Bathyarchaeia archaeon]
MQPRVGAIDMLMKWIIAPSEKKPKARPGNPLRYRLTLDVGEIAIPNWPRTTVQERLMSTHRDNYAALILDLSRFLGAF